MTDQIIPTNTQALLDTWLEAERNGERFPVPFEAAYPMAGYKRKDNAKRALPKGSQGELFLISEEKATGGRPRQIISLSIAGFEHLCLMADTQEGHDVREYYRACRQKLESIQGHSNVEVVDTVAEEIKPEPTAVDAVDNELRRLRELTELALKLDATPAEKSLIRAKVISLVTGEPVKQPEQEPNWELPPGFQDQPRFPQPVQLAISVSERARALGYRLSPGQLIIAGNHASKEYKRRYGTAPEKRYRIIDDERTQYVNVYVSPRDLGILDAAIQAVAAVAG